MAQHLWRGFLTARTCEVCLTTQFERQVGWTPPVSPICAGDPDDGGRRVTRRRPNAPSGALEDCRPNLGQQPRRNAPAGTPLRVLEDA